MIPTASLINVELALETCEDVSAKTLIMASELDEAHAPPC
jgi:hypothetical protein